MNNTCSFEDLLYNILEKIKKFCGGIKGECIKDRQTDRQTEAQRYIKSGKERDNENKDLTGGPGPGCLKAGSCCSQDQTLRIYFSLLYQLSH